MNDINLKNKLPIALKNDFWIELLGSVEDEMYLMINKIEEKKYIYSIDLSTNEDIYDLVKLVYSDFYSTFLSLKKSLLTQYNMSEEEFIKLTRDELHKKPYQSVYKGTLALYKTFFNIYGYSFPYEISIYTTIPGDIDNCTSIQNIKRNIKTLFTSDNLNSMIGTQESDNNFLGVVEVQNNPVLDRETPYQLDLTVDFVNSLDNQFFDTVNVTKHIGLECVLNQLYLKGNNLVLLPYEILLYIKEITKKYKRATEVPHVGSQFTVKIDNSGLYNLNPEIYYGENVVENFDFDKDILWQKENSWTISNSKAIKSGSTSSKLVYPNSIFDKPTRVEIKIQVDQLDNDLKIYDSQDVLLTTISSTGETNVFLDWTSISGGFYLQSDSTVEIDWITITSAEIYTNAATHLRATTNSTYISEGLKEITAIEFGYGEQSFDSYPTELQHPLAKVKPLEVQTYSNDKYIGAISEYIGQLFNNIKLHDNTGYLLSTSGSGAFDNSNQEFTGTIEDRFLTLKPFNVVFGLKNIVTDDYVDYIQDNGYGQLLSQNNTLQGTINYTNGSYSLSSSFLASQEDDFGDMEIESTSYSNSLTNIVFENSGSFLFIYNGIQYSINVETDNTLTSNFDLLNLSTSSFTRGTLDSSFVFNFTQSIKLEDMRFLYQYEKNSTFSADYELEVYKGYCNKQHAVTEVGIYGKTDLDDNEKLLSYMTFAPIELYSNELHLNLGVILEK